MAPLSAEEFLKRLGQLCLEFEGPDPTVCIGLIVMMPNGEELVWRGELKPHTNPNKCYWCGQTKGDTMLYYEFVEQGTVHLKIGRPGHGATIALVILVPYEDEPNRMVWRLAEMVNDHGMMPSWEAVKKIADIMKELEERAVLQNHARLHDGPGRP